MKLTIAGAALTMLLMGCSTSTEDASVASNVTTEIPVQASTSAPAESFIPTSFNPPVLVETETFKLVPLGPELAKIDFDAYMSSIEHLSLIHI